MFDRTYSYYVTLAKIIERAKKKEPNFNGIIFKTEELSKADLTVFAASQKETENSAEKYKFEPGENVSWYLTYTPGMNLA